MNRTTTQFLCSDPAMYMSPGRTYARVGIQDPARIFFLAHWPMYVCVHATCAPLLRHVPFLAQTWFIATACRQTDRPVCTYTFATRMTTLRTLRPGGSRLSGRIRRHFLACEDVAGGSQLSGGKLFFVARNMDALPCVRRCSWWVPAVRCRNNYFARNKEALPCGCRGPSCQPLHVQYSSDGSRSLTTLTMPRGEHQGGGRRQGLGRG